MTDEHLRAPHVSWKMLFNSLHFAVFFPLVATAYFLLPHRARWVWLLLASCYFYMAFIPYYILILALTIGVDYVAGLLIWRSGGSSRKALLVMSIVANVGILGVFKYSTFLATNLHSLGRLLGQQWSFPVIAAALPIGLSFHTFQSMAYTIEVYRKNQEPERNLGIFALYVLFFPQMVAGPIERPQNLLHQFREKHFFRYEEAREGLKLVLWGLFEKMVIADRIAPLVNKVYSSPHDFGGLSLMLGTALFAFQILCDFAGYSDIARGIARILGFRLMVNFRQPYLARSVAEFWKRWHISLSTWFLDYVYKPLGGSRTTPARHRGNVMTVFALSGLWHGADWKFVVWGALNGLFVVSGRALGLESDSKGPAPWPLTLLRRLVTFSLVCLTWIFFRAASMEDSLTVLRNMFFHPVDNIVQTFGKAPLAFAVLFLGVIIVAQFVRESGRTFVANRPAWARWAIYTGSLMLLILLGEFSSKDFIYFQF